VCVSLKAATYLVRVSCLRVRPVVVLEADHKQIYIFLLLHSLMKRRVAQGSA